jgi:hypothetical protein
MKSSPTPPAAGNASSTLLTLLQVAGIVGLLIWAIMLKRDLEATHQELATVRNRPAPANNLQGENRSLRSQVAELEAQLAEAKSLAAAAPAPVPPKPAPAAPASPMSAIASLMNNPALRNQIAATQKRMVEMRYAELFTQLQLSPEQRARFIDLFSETQSAATDVGLKLLSGNLSPAEQAGIRQQAKDMDASTEAKVREFLGDDAKFAVYKQFNEQQTERTQVSALKNSLNQSGLPPLTTEQSAALTDIMYSERKNFPFTPNPSADPADRLTAPSPEAVEARIRDQTTLNERIANRAATVLNADQLTAFRREQAVRVESIKTSSEMARQLLGGALPASK